MEYLTPDVLALIRELSKLGARLEVDGERLLCHVPGGNLSADLATRIRQHKPQLVAQLRFSGNSAEVPMVVIAGKVPARFPLSNVQTRIWLHERLHEASDFYVVSLGLRIEGPLSVAALQKAWWLLNERHGALRTVLVPSGDRLVQHVRPDAATPLSSHPLGQVKGTASLASATEFLAAQRTPMRAAAGEPLVRARIFTDDALLHLLLIEVHHVLADGWSLGLLLREMLETYRALEAGQEVSASPPQVTYHDYVVWHAAYLEHSAFEADLAYWKSALHGAPQCFDPPLRMSAAEQESLSPRVLESRLRVEPELVAGIGAWATMHGGTLHSALLTAWCITLDFWADRGEFVMGIVTAGRPTPAFEGVFGCFMNTLPLRVQMDPESTFASAHAAIVQRLLAAYEHQNCPVDRIVAALPVRRSAMRNPLYNVAFLLQNFPAPKPLREELRIDHLPLPHPPGSLDLRLVAGQVDDDLLLSMEFNVSYLDEGDAARLLGVYRQLVEACITRSDLPLAQLRREIDWGSVRVRQRVVVGGTFTVEPLAATLDFWLDDLDLPYSVRFAPFAQVMESLLDPASLMRSASDHNCLFVRLEDWLGDGSSSSPERLVAHTELFVRACSEYAVRCRVPLTVWLCPASGRTRDTVEAAALEKCAVELARGVEGLGRIRLRTADSYAAKYDFSEPDDEYLGEVASVPYRSRIYAGLATLLVRELAAAERPPLKAVVLDADNTLWNGVCGEDGAAGVVFDDAAIALQQFFASLRQTGVALCICSKNAEDDVREVLATRAENVLRWEDFSAHRINWQRKSDNIAQIARELDIGLDTIVFVDDAAAECQEVGAALPEVRCVGLPAQRREIPAFLHGVWDLDVVEVSPQARLRLETYRLNRGREELRKESMDHEAYLRSLKVDATVRPALPEDHARLTELAMRTTQFNFSGRRKTEPQLAAFVASPGAHCFVVEVRDRFGSYGLTGSVWCTVAGGLCQVDNFVLSCRVLGKRVEHRVMEVLQERLVRLGVNRMEVEYVRTARNEPARAFGDAFFDTPVPPEAGLHVYTRSFTMGDAQ